MNLGSQHARFAKPVKFNSKRLLRAGKLDARTKETDEGRHSCKVAWSHDAYLGTSW
jgi:hypothetical protein